MGFVYPDFFSQSPDPLSELCLQFLILNRSHIDLNICQTPKEACSREVPGTFQIRCRVWVAVPDEPETQIENTFARLTIRQGNPGGLGEGFLNCRLTASSLCFSLYRQLMAGQNLLKSL